MNVKTYLAVVCVCGLTLMSCDTTRDVLERSQQFADARNFHQAYWVIADALDQNPDDPDLERIYWERRLDYLLDRGEDLLFNEQEHKAIAEFQKALALDNDNAKAKALIGRAKQKLAMDALQIAETRHNEGNLVEALKFYNKASSYVAEIPAAIEGIAKVNDEFEKRTDKSTEHYIYGARARGEQHYVRSHYHGKVAIGYDESNNRAKKLVTDAGRRLAQTLLQRARAAEEEGFYAAALNEYRRVKDQLPDTPGIDRHIAEMEAEIKVIRICREAEMMSRKKDFDGADKALNEAFQLSRFEKARVSGLMLEAKMLRYEEAYTKAKDLELENRFEDALAAYEAIDKANPKRDFLDVKERIAGLKSHLSEAKKSFDKGQAAEKAGELKKAIDFYEEAVLVYPGYKKLEARIKALRAKIGS